MILDLLSKGSNGKAEGEACSVVLTEQGAWGSFFLSWAALSALLAGPHFFIYKTGKGEIMIVTVGNKVCIRSWHQEGLFQTTKLKKKKSLRIIQAKSRNIVFWQRYKATKTLITLLLGMSVDIISLGKTALPNKVKICIPYKHQFLI